ncbi:MAG: DUF3256 family protein [Candidatus Amulumruptor caecigallinarius]|nr:DUF3256 family protein [Candidatus Amulumruptor caecigallinarius]MCM1396170.1 DUF3256 family protein [Candidatus Amulumruptor caecigallinarius]MCM1453830.1 DUF3256 family protein [bacterium]
MIKSIVLLLAAAAAVALIAPGAKAQLTAGKAFATAPQTVFPLLDAGTRLDMIDYYNSNLSTPSTNKLQGRSRITAMNDKALTVEMSPASTNEIFILPNGSDSIIAVITTLATPTPDSHISFYTADWKALDTAKYFDKPLLGDWLTDDGKKNRSQVEAMVPFLLIGYQWDPATNVLTLTNNTGQFLSADIYETVSGYMYPSLKYQWNGRKMTPAND